MLKFVNLQADTNVKFDAEWDTALPYSRMPGPSRLDLLRGFSPGGK